MTDNTVVLIADVVEALEEAQIKTWLFGGWAEELSGLRLTGPHRDVDLLYPAQNFTRLDEFLTAREELEAVPSKWFSHKRAFCRQGILVEVFLVQSEAERLVTEFFGTHRFLWPEDTLLHRVLLNGRQYPLASRAALKRYREQHDEVEQAYQQHLADSVVK